MFSGVQLGWDAEVGGFASTHVDHVQGEGEWDGAIQGTEEGFVIRGEGSSDGDTRAGRGEKVHEVFGQLSAEPVEPLPIRPRYPGVDHRGQQDFLIR